MLCETLTSCQDIIQTTTSTLALSGPCVVAFVFLPFCLCFRFTVQYAVQCVLISSYISTSMQSIVGPDDVVNQAAEMGAKFASSGERACTTQLGYVMNLRLSYCLAQ